jgi:hypothetical protein
MHRNHPWNSGTARTGGCGGVTYISPKCSLGVIVEPGAAMSQPPAISTDESPVPGSVASGERVRSFATVRALEIQLQYFNTGGSFAEIMQAKVLGSVPPHVAKMWGDELGKKHQQQMLSPDFQRLLGIIWKESDFVSPGDLRAAGLERNFEPGALNSHSLGCLIATGKSTLNAATQRVAAFVAMAVRYRLVEQVRSKSKPIELRATELLHEVMLAIGAPSVTDAFASSTSNISALSRIDGR